MPIDLAKAVGGGGGSVDRRERVLVESQTFVAPIDATYLVTAIGGGGAGGIAYPSYGGVASGGGAGGLSQKKVKLLAGESLTITVGAGGAPGGYNTTGGNGGDTSVSGSGIALVGYGGKGGLYQISSSASAISVAGGAGGAASGGDVNITGGAGGLAQITSASSSYRAGSGGGAVGVYGVGYSAAAAVLPSGYSSPVASGGAGVGGASGTPSAPSSFVTVGGGALAPASGSTPPLEVSEYAQVRQLNPLGTSSSLSGGLVEPVSRPGAGGNAIGTNSTANDWYAGKGGMFAGGGAYVNTAASGGKGYAGDGSFGGGGGACVSYNGSSRAGRGGGGCVIIEWLEELAV